MTVRDERAAALIRRHRDLSDDFTRALPGLLDDLEAIDERYLHGAAGTAGGAPSEGADETPAIPPAAPRRRSGHRSVG